MVSSDIFCSLVVPAYNEQYRLKPPLVHALEYCSNFFIRGWEVVCVDDGSTDGTWDTLSEIATDYPQMRVLRHDRNCGKGRAIRTGLGAARGDLVMFSDADFSTPVEEIAKLIEPISEGFDIAIGSRGLEQSNVEVHQPWLREILGKAGNLVIRTMLDLPVSDTQCGFKLFKREVVNFLLPLMTIDGFAFDVEMLAVARLHGFKIKEVPVTWRNVLHSKVGTADSLLVLRDVFQIRFRIAMSLYSAERSESENL